MQQLRIAQTVKGKTQGKISETSESYINNNNNNNYYNHHHLPGPPGSNCRSCSVPALFSPRHAVSHQAFRIYNIKPHQKVQHTVLANRVVGANQLNSPPSHSHIRTHTLSHSHSHLETQSTPKLTIFTRTFICAQPFTFAVCIRQHSVRLTRHAHAHSHLFTLPFSMHHIVNI